MLIEPIQFTMINAFSISTSAPTLIDPNFNLSLSLSPNSLRHSYHQCNKTHSFEKCFCHFSRFITAKIHQTFGCNKKRKKKTVSDWKRKMKKGKNISDI